MSVARAAKLVRRTLLGGRRNPMLYAALAVPFLYTLIIQLIFGTFWQQEPTLAVFEGGRRAIVPVLQRNGAVRVAPTASAGEVKRIVTEKKADVGIVLSADLAEKLSANEQATLTVYIGGESLAQSRAVALAAVVDTLRQQSPHVPQIDFAQKYVGEEQALSISQMLLPFIVMVTVFFGGFMIPASMLIQEREKKTLDALLVTPVQPLDVLAAYGFLGATLAILVGVLTLLFNQSWNQPPLLILVMTLGAILMAEWGLVAGIFIKDTATLFANMKLFGIFLYGPALFIVFPSWPQWISRLFPTHYFIYPVFRISIYREGLSSVGSDVAILGALTLVSLLPIFFLSRRLASL